MSFLLDTNVVSELRKGARCNPGVRRWLDDADDAALFLSVLTLGEIRRGIELLARRDVAAARVLTRWLSGLENNFQDRILPVTTEIALIWGSLSVERPLGAVDGLLAATALNHRLTLVTRNVADVKRAGVTVLNPFSR